MLIEAKTHHHTAAQFQIKGRIDSITPYGSGHINDTFLMKTKHNDTPNYILQKINHRVFNNVPALMNNVLRVTEHVRQKLVERHSPNLESQCLTLILTTSGHAYYQDNQGSFWRLYRFIKNTCFHDIVPNASIAQRGGRAFGLFQTLLADLPAPELHETIPHFHHIDSRFQLFEHAVHRDTHNRANQAKALFEFILERKERMRTLLTLAEQNKIPKRVTHNDTKFNNVLLSTTHDTGCVIDLDTVMPGYLQYDFSDTIRTATNTAVEDELDLSKVSMSLDLFSGFATGFLSEAGHTLCPNEIEQLSDSADFLPFIIGLRFLTDYLSGDHYFKIHRPHHNLQRAQVQFKLVESIEQQKPKMRGMITSILKTASA